MSSINSSSNKENEAMLSDGYVAGHPRVIVHVMDAVGLSCDRKSATFCRIAIALLRRAPSGLLSEIRSTETIFRKCNRMMSWDVTLELAFDELVDLSTTGIQSNKDLVIEFRLLLEPREELTDDTLSPQANLLANCYSSQLEFVQFLSTYQNAKCRRIDDVFELIRQETAESSHDLASVRIRLGILVLLVGTSTESENEAMTRFQTKSVPQQHRTINQIPAVNAVLSHHAASTIKSNRQPSKSNDLCSVKEGKIKSNPMFNMTTQIEKIFVRLRTQTNDNSATLHISSTALTEFLRLFSNAAAEELETFVMNIIMNRNSNIASNNSALSSSKHKLSKLVAPSSPRSNIPYEVAKDSLPYDPFMSTLLDNMSFKTKADGTSKVMFCESSVVKFIAIISSDGSRLSGLTGLSKTVEELQSIESLIATEVASTAKQFSLYLSDKNVFNEDHINARDLELDYERIVAVANSCLSKAQEVQTNGGERSLCVANLEQSLQSLGQLRQKIMLGPEIKSKENNILSNHINPTPSIAFFKHNAEIRRVEERIHIALQRLQEIADASISIAAQSLQVNFSSLQSKPATDLKVDIVRINNLVDSIGVRISLLLPERSPAVITSAVRGALFEEHGIQQNTGLAPLNSAAISRLSSLIGHSLSDGFVENAQRSFEYSINAATKVPSRVTLLLDEGDSHAFAIKCLVAEMCDIVSEEMAGGEKLDDVICSHSILLFNRNRAISFLEKEVTLLYCLAMTAASNDRDKNASAMSVYRDTCLSYSSGFDILHIMLLGFVKRKMSGSASDFECSTGAYLRWFKTIFDQTVHSRSTDYDAPYDLASWYRGDSSDTTGFMSTVHNLLQICQAKDTTEVQVMRSNLSNVLNTNSALERLVFDDGDTILHIAVRGDYPIFAGLLLQRNIVRVKHRNRDGCLASELAKSEMMKALFPGHRSRAIRKAAAASGDSTGALSGTNEMR